MNETIISRIKRKIRDMKIEIVHFIIKKAVKKLDDLHYGVFMAYSWAQDNTTDYHLMKEISLPHYHCIGTKVDRFDDVDEEEGW